MLAKQLEALGVKIPEILLPNAKVDPEKMGCGGL